MSGDHPTLCPRCHRPPDDHAEGCDEDIPGPAGALADLIGYLLPLEQEDRIRVLDAVAAYFKTGPELPPTRDSGKA